MGGTETETTLRRNRLALDSDRVPPARAHRRLAVDASAQFFGRRVPMPVALAPVGSLESFDPGGGATVAKAAARVGVPLFVSSVTAPGLEATAAAADGPKVFQLYVRGGDDFVDDHVRRAVDAGYMAFCITVDTALYSRRERDIAKRFVKHWRARHTGMEFQAAFDWAKVARFRDRHDVPLILKGIATAEDAARACELGVAGIYVSNHGGRQLDHGRGALDLLPEVVGAVAGRARVIVDGGFSRGTDIVKAIALGADTVAIGRLYLYGLAAGGAEGVARVLEILQDEIEITLGLLGVAAWPQLDRSYLHPAPPVAPPHGHSAFPLLAEDY